MSTIRNPFVELYVTENYSAEKFIKIFSPVLLAHSETLTLFQPGNVILTGLQGSGKTALLNLLRPEVRIAYRKANISNPIPEYCQDFISAGINLSKSGARDFGQRFNASESKEKKIRIALQFGDFLNYWIVNDIFETLETLRSGGESEYLKLDFSKSNLKKFTRLLCDHKCWSGSLAGCEDYSQLRTTIEMRIDEYREFLNFNRDLNPTFEKTKTTPGEPIGVVVELLKSSGIVPESLPFFVRIDQFEDLMGIEAGHDGSLATAFRGVIMGILGSRDDRVHYRIGARPYSFSPNFQMLGTSSSAEVLRNFKLVDLGDLFKGRESRKTIFPEFCEDVFNRRLNSIELDDLKNTKTNKHTIAKFFGPRVPPSEKAIKYVKSSEKSFIGNVNSLAGESLEVLETLSKTQPLSAKLGEAWCRQNSRKGGDVKLDELTDLPWESKQKQWWKKERIQIALMQIAASRQQRMIWYGKNDVLTVSSKNILVFLTICQFVWAEYLRNMPSGTSKYKTPFSPSTQTMGIHEASAYWFTKIKADPNGGDDRHKFLNRVAPFIRKRMVSDLNMSYPGANGFSLAEKDLEKDPKVAQFLDLCVAYGALESVPHTAKTRSRNPSKKWYLYSIITPYFQLPTPHTKEPLYLKVEDVRSWMKEAGIADVNIVKQSGAVDYSDMQLDLGFGIED